MTEKPRYFSIVVFDIERFGPRADPVPEPLVERAFALVDSALTSAGIAGATHVARRGDGGFVLVGSSVAKSDIGEAFIRNLNDGLRQHAHIAGAASRLRLRVALHAGDVTHDDGGGWSGTELDTAFRLADSLALRSALSGADQADMAVIVSWTWYDAVVWHQRGGIDRTTYRRVPLDLVHAHTTAWVHVPGYLSPPVAGWPDPALPGPRAKPAARRRHARPAR